MLELVQQFANAWLTWWMAGLLLSFRMIVPAQSFLSERSARWLSNQLTNANGINARRRFNLSFKRYVDRTLHARQVRVGRLRFWTLRYRKTAVFSLVTFLLIYTGVLLTLDFDQIYRGVIALRESFSDPGSTNYDPKIAGFAELVADLDLGLLVGAMMLFNGIFLALFNTITDYVSFLETRNVLARLGRGPLRDIFWVIVDFTLTTTICVLGFTFFWVFTSYAGTILSGRSLSFVEISYEGLVLGVFALYRAVETLGEARPAMDLTDPAVVSMAYSTYATSIWIWVFFISTLLLRSIVLFRPLLRLARFLIDVEDHPFRAAWLVFAVFWTLGLTAYANLV
ncbi:MAG: hypothetical protein AB8B62_19945 [Roseobacter sp.]